MARTDVEVLTDLKITGKAAQFGRGVIQDVSDKLPRPVRGLPGRAAQGGDSSTPHRPRRSPLHPAATADWPWRPRPAPAPQTERRGPASVPPRPAGQGQQHRRPRLERCLPILVKTCSKQGLASLVTLKS